MQLNYTLVGAIEVPEGSTLTDTGTGIILPDGRILKLWEAWEIHTQGEDDHETLSYEEVTALDCHYDGDLSRFEVVP